MRLIDADKLMLSLNDNYLTNSPTGNETLAVQDYRESICEGLEIAMATVEETQTVDVLQKLWNALYAEEDKFEKRYIGTQEHDNWFSVYRPWLQNGFGIAIKVLSEIFAPEPPKEKENDRA
jgi:hypothetical protein